MPVKTHAYKCGICGEVYTANTKDEAFRLAQQCERHGTPPYQLEIGFTFQGKVGYGGEIELIVISRKIVLWQNHGTPLHVAVYQISYSSDRSKVMGWYTSNDILRSTVISLK